MTFSLDEHGSFASAENHDVMEKCGGVKKDEDDTSITLDECLSTNLGDWNSVTSSEDDGKSKNQHIGGGETAGAASPSAPITPGSTCLIRSRLSQRNLRSKSPSQAQSMSLIETIINREGAAASGDIRQRSPKAPLRKSLEPVMLKGTLLQDSTSLEFAYTGVSVPTLRSSMKKSASKQSAISSSSMRKSLNDKETKKTTKTKRRKSLDTAALFQTLETPNSPTEGGDSVGSGGKSVGSGGSKSNSKTNSASGSILRKSLNEKETSGSKKTMKRRKSADSASLMAMAMGIAPEDTAALLASLPNEIPKTLNPVTKSLDTAQSVTDTLLASTATSLDITQWLASEQLESSGPSADGQSITKTTLKRRKSFDSKSLMAVAKGSAPELSSAPLAKAGSSSSVSSGNKQLVRRTSWGSGQMATSALEMIVSPGGQNNSNSKTPQKRRKSFDSNSRMAIVYKASVSGSVTVSLSPLATATGTTSRASSPTATSSHNGSNQQVRRKSLSSAQMPTSAMEMVAVSSPKSGNGVKKPMKRTKSLDSLSLAALTNGGNSSTVAQKTIKMVAQCEVPDSLDRSSDESTMKSSTSYSSSVWGKIVRQASNRQMSKRLLLQQENLEDKPAAASDKSLSGTRRSSKDLRGSSKKNSSEASSGNLLTEPMPSTKDLAPQECRKPLTRQGSKKIYIEPTSSENPAPTENKKKVTRQGSKKINMDDLVGSEDPAATENKKKLTRQGSKKINMDDLVGSEDPAPTENKKKLTRQGSKKICIDNLVASENPVPTENKKKLTRQGSKKINMDDLVVSEDPIPTESKKKLTRQGSKKINMDDLVGSEDPVPTESKKKLTRQGSKKINMGDVFGTGSKKQLESSSKESGSSNKKLLRQGSKRIKEPAQQESKRSLSSSLTEKKGGEKKQSKCGTDKPKSRSSSLKSTDPNSAHAVGDDTESTCMDMTETSTTELEDILNFNQVMDAALSAILQESDPGHGLFFSQHDEILDNEDEMDSAFSVLMNNSLTGDAISLFD